MMGMYVVFILLDVFLELCVVNMLDGIGYYIYIVEDLVDVYDFLKKYGKLIVNWLFDLGILGK